MILFESIRYRNFLSTGNNFTEIDFTRNSTTLVLGHNGAGKSTMLDALSFALFGKAHRNVNKNDLINSINNKNCEVEIKFKIGSNNYRIFRGIKPNVFEIYHNDKLMNQESHSRDYQKILENNILKLNHKSFHQIVVLGSGNFTPFMQLPVGQRRDVIEDLLDISIFTDMNKILKERTSRIKDDIKTTEIQIGFIDEKAQLQQKHINELESINIKRALNKSKKIEEINSEIDLLNDRNKKIIGEHKEKHPVAKTKLMQLNVNRSECQEDKNHLNNKILHLNEHIKWLKGNDKCQTCERELDNDWKEERIKDDQTKRESLTSEINELKDKLKEYDEVCNVAEENLKALESLEHDFNTNTKLITNLQNQITNLQNEKTLEETDLTSATQELLDLKQKVIDTKENKFKLVEEKSYQDVISELLKDSGIKTKIIRQYLPIMNKLINQYLGVLDFFVKFELDERFDETIKSRHRDKFRYACFSEGEKSRIDLSLLFAWRQIAKMKNSTNTNLLILDETFDSSLDSDGLENLQKILHTIKKDTNVFIISHKKDVLDGKFEGRIEFEKSNNFSEIKKNN